MSPFLSRAQGVLTSIRVWTVNLFTLLFLAYLVVLAVLFIRQLPGKVDPQGKVLILNPTGQVQDQEVFPAGFELPMLVSNDAQIQTRDLIRVIRAAAVDERLTGVLLDFSKASFSGPTTALQVATELAALKAAGKPVLAYSESLGTSAYLMATQADEIYVHPSGALSITGLGGYREYTREITDKLKITMHNYSQGDFKSAVEGRTRMSMSEADRMQREELYGPIWSALKARMAAARNLDSTLLQTVADDHSVPLLNEAGYDNLAFAQEQGLIDGTLGFPGLRALMIERFGKSEDEERDTYPHIGWDAYQAQLEPESTDAPDAVAVVFVEGGIMPGALAPGVAGAEDVAGLLRRAHEAKDTRAVVLRVNSPGGSVIASDIIRDELAAAKSKGLPVVVSMGDVAASGGVWVSTPADHIFAQATTITGSIGVAVAFPTLERTFEHIGVGFDGVTTSQFAGWGVYQGVNDKLDAMFSRWASSAYQRFIDLVAASRGRDAEYIRSIAGGRVWLGERALELGLIDELGNLEDAIGHAAQLAGSEDYRVDYVVKAPSPAAALIRRFTGALGFTVHSSFGSFAERVAGALASLEGLNQPRATVLCGECTIEIM